MGAALARRECVHFVDDNGLHRPQRLPRARAEQQKQRLGRRDQYLRRRPQLPLTLALRRIAGAHSHGYAGEGAAAALRGAPDAGQRRAQVALDVVDERLERRDVEHAHAGLAARVGAGETVDGPQESGQRLAAAGRGHQQCVSAAADDRPAAALDLGGARKARVEPVLCGGAEHCAWTRGELPRTPAAGCWRIDAALSVPRPRPRAKRSPCSPASRQSRSQL